MMLISDFLIHTHAHTHSWPLTQAHNNALFKNVTYENNFMYMFSTLVAV